MHAFKVSMQASALRLHDWVWRPCDENQISLKRQSRTFAVLLPLSSPIRAELVLSAPSGE